MIKGYWVLWVGVQKRLGFESKWCVVGLGTLETMWNWTFLVLQRFLIPGLWLMVYRFGVYGVIATVTAIVVVTIIETYPVRSWDIQLPQSLLV